MPVFEYTCGKCGLEFEKLVFGGQKVICSVCGSEDVKKRFSLFGMSGVEHPVSSGCTSCKTSSCKSCK